MNAGDTSMRTAVMKRCAAALNHCSGRTTAGASTSIPPPRICRTSGRSSTTAGMRPQRVQGVKLGGGGDPLIVFTLGRYRISSLLGIGGMGVVYRAEQHHPQRTVAIKVIPVSYTHLTLPTNREV